jgi:hypothetical protein
MKTLQDVLEKTNELYPFEKIETRKIRGEIIRELFFVCEDTRRWNHIDVFNQNKQLDYVLNKYFGQAVP